MFLTIANTLIVGLALVGLFLLINWFWSRNRASANFNLSYIRALRVEKSKKTAIREALRHLKTFLKPFDQLSEAEIDTIAEIFCEVDDPKTDLQPVLEHARKTGNLDSLKDAERMKQWRSKPQTER